MSNAGMRLRCVESGPRPGEFIGRTAEIAYHILRGAVGRLRSRGFSDSARLALASANAGSCRSAPFSTRPRVIQLELAGVSGVDTIVSVDIEAQVTRKCPGNF